jgi:ADP-heptose:LPS heptosyltransferase
MRKGLQPGQRLVAIILVEHFGDIVACEPVVRYVHAQYPNDLLIWVCRRQYYDLVSSHPKLNAVLPVSCLTEAFLLRDSGVFDRAIDLHINGRVCDWFGTVQNKAAGNANITINNYFSYGSLLESFCQAAGLPPLRDNPVIHVPPAKKHLNSLPPLPYMIIHATSSKPERDWPPEKWTALLDALAKEFTGVFVEVGLEPRIAPGGRIINRCGQLSLMELAVLFQHCAAFIGIDSGPAHLANAFCRPSVILMGRFKDFERYMPYSGFLQDHSEEMLLRSSGLVAEISIKEAAARVTEVLRKYLQ